MTPRLTGTPRPPDRYWFEGILHAGMAPRRRFLRRGVGLAFALAMLPAPLSAVPDSTPAAPNYSLFLYNVYSGLPSNSSPVVKQTREGYLWAGTELGLGRFDGVRFVTYRASTTPELPSSLIRGLYEDSAGWLWIATQDGLCRYRQGRFERMLDGVPATSVVEDQRGSVWIGTLGQGLREFRNGHLISHRGTPGIPAEITLVFVDSRQRLWVGSSREMVFFDGKTVHPLDLGTPPFEGILNLVETAAGVFWINTTQGLYRWHEGKFTHFGVEAGLGADLIRNLYLDRKGRLWVVMNQLYALDPNNAERFVPVALPGVENARAVTEDAEGSYWVGTAGDGVVGIRPSGFRMLAAETDVLGGHTRTVARDRDGNIWAGLGLTGAARLAPDGKIMVVPTSPGLSGEVWSVLPAADGRVWIGTRTSLYHWQENKIQEVPGFQRIRGLFQESDGTIWISSETAGIVRYREGVFTSMDEAIKARQPGPRTTLPPVAMTFAEDQDHALYIGLREGGGLVKIKNEVITVYHPRDGFPTNEVRAIYPDRDGNLWVGTKGRGLAVLTGGRWLNPEILSASFNDQVSAIVEDNQGRFWLGTPKGIAWAPKAELLALARGAEMNGVFRLALETDGIRPAVVGSGTFPMMTKAPDGKVWVGTRRGLAVIDPSAIVLNTVPPAVRIEQVVIDDQVNPFPSEIRLPPGTQALTVNYTALSFVGPSQVRFRYRLEGHDRQWTEAGTRRAAFYTNLEPGTFRFHVLACNDDGVWNETGASMAIVQLPYFYRTPGFYGLATLGLIGSGMGFFRWRTEALKRRNAELERGIAERTAELAKSYDAVRASEYFYHSLVESLPQIILRKDTANRYTYANAAFSELIGRPLDQIIGRLEEELYPAEKAERFRADDVRAMESRQTLEYETVDERGGRPLRYLHVKKVPLYDPQGRSMGVQVLFWDMTTFREIEKKLKQAQRDLVETSRLAGIAEMATGILHNLGNALNSVNVTTNLTITRIRDSKIEFVRKTAQLLAEHSDRLPEFFSSDPRGRKLPAYLADLAHHLTLERDEILTELKGLQVSVDHIKELVASQQKHAHVNGVTEVVAASELVEYALRISDSALKRNQIAVVREITAAPFVQVERQKALQIIGNLIANARDALLEGARPEKRLAIGVRLSSEGRVQIYVTDNGLGIAPENLTRIFAFGFTTKTNGHGFGLHSSALAAKEIGGALHGYSDGPGRGATFVLELPLATSA